MSAHAKALVLVLAAALPQLGVLAQVVDQASARRTLGALCRAQAGQVQTAWLGRPNCQAPARPVRLEQRLPDTELIVALEQHAKVLAQARLLFAGNTSCASQRSFNFALVSLGVSAAGKQSEEMVQWVFESDHKTAARVWARKNGASYDVWYVACEAGPAR